MADQAVTPHLQGRLRTRLKAMQAAGATKEQMRAALPQLRAEAAEGFSGFPGQTGEAGLGKPRTAAGAPVESAPASKPFMDRVGDALGSAAHTVGAGFGLVDPTPADVDRLNRIEHFGDRASNMLTFGASRPVMDMLGAWFGAENFSSPERRAELTQAYPKTGVAGDVGGGLLGAWMGPARLLDQTVRAAVPKILPNVVEKSMPVVTRMAPPVSTSVVENAAQNWSEGGTLEERVSRLPQNAGTAVALGAGGQAVGDTLSAASDAVKKVGGWTKDFIEANRRGAYETPDLVNSPNAWSAARKGEKRFAQRNAELDEEGQAMLRADRKPDLGVGIPRKDLRDRVNALIEGNLDGIPAPGWPKGRPRDFRKHEALESLLGNTDEGLDLLRTVEQDPVTKRFRAVPDPTYETMIIKRSAEQKAGKYGKAADASKEQVRAQTRAEAMNDVIKPSIPERSRLAEERAHERASARERERDIFYNSEERVNRGTAEDPDLRVSKEKAGARFLGRVGDVNKPGEEAAEYLEELAKADPEYRALIDMVRAAKARDATKFTLSPPLPGSGTLDETNKWAGFGPTIQQLARWGLARVAEPTLRMGGEAIPTATPRLVPLLTDPVAAVLEGRKKKEKKK